MFVTILYLCCTVVVSNSDTHHIVRFNICLVLETEIYRFSTYR